MPAITSQFDSSRAVCGLPLGSPERHSDAVMKNLMGDDITSWREFLASPAPSCTSTARPRSRAGRKMGHVTRLTAKSS